MIPALSESNISSLGAANRQKCIDKFRISKGRLFLHERQIGAILHFPLQLNIQQQRSKLSNADKTPGRVNVDVRSGPPVGEELIEKISALIEAAFYAEGSDGLKSYPAPRGPAQEYSARP